MSIRKVPDGTEHEDLFGVGVDGYSSGDAATLQSATLVSHFAMNHGQEEIARAVEGSGQSVTSYANASSAQAAQDADTMEYGQLDQAIRSGDMTVPPSAAVEGVLRGMQFTSALLVATLGEGVLLDDGRKYVITLQKLSDAGHTVWDLVATRDNYFFAAHQDPADVVSNERTVFVETADVAVGAAAPATPAGTFLFAVLTTDATVVTSSTYHSHGTPIANASGVGIRAKTPDNAAQECSFVPYGGTNVDIGVRVNAEDAQPSTASTLRTVAARNLDVVPSTLPVDSEAYSATFARSSTTTGGGDTSDIVLYDEADFQDGAMIKIRAHALAHDTTDASDSYCSTSEFYVFKDGGAFNLDSSGVAIPQFESASPPAGVTVSANISAGVLRFRVEGTSTAAAVMRWYVRFEVDVIQPNTDNP